jgi:hypothetical protein
LFADGENLWPTRPALTAKSKGYRLDPKGHPTFLYEYVGVSLEDQIVPQDDGRGLSRHLHFTGSPWEKNLWMLVAESSAITTQPGGQGYIVGDREFYLDWPATAPLKPMIRTAGGVSQIVVALPPDGAAQDVNYNLVW